MPAGPGPISPRSEIVGGLLPWVGFFAATTLKDLFILSSTDPWGGRHGYPLPPSCIGTYLLLFAPLWLLSPRLRYVAAMALSAVLSVLLLADTLYFRFTGDIVSLAALTGATEMAVALPSGISLLMPRDSLLAADLVIALVLARRYFRSCGPGIGSLRTRAYASAFCVLAAAGLWRGQVDAIGPDRDGLLASCLQADLATRFGLINAHLFDSTRALQYGQPYREPSAEELQRLLQEVRDNRDHESPPSELWGSAHGKNVIVIIVESLAAFPIGLECQGQEVTPNLNRLARESITFDRFFDQAWRGYSSDGEILSLQGLHPLPSGAAATLYPQNSFRGVPRLLQERGYATMASSGFRGQLWNYNIRHPRLGFERSYFADSFHSSEQGELGIADRPFLVQNLDLIDELPRPFMAFVMTQSTHHPYRLPDGSPRLGCGSPDDALLGSYLDVVHYVDDSLGQFREGLERRGLLDDTVIALYGDHKAYLGDEASAVQGIARLRGERIDPGNQNARFLTLNRLPFMVRMPDGRNAGPRSVTGGTIDVGRTLLGLLGVPDDDMVSLGSDLLRETGGSVTFRDGSFIDGTVYCRARRDGTLESCVHADTLRPVDSSGELAFASKARQRLALSDRIIASNLVPPEPLAR